MSDLKKKLIEKQKELNEGDRTFCLRLGVSHWYWWQVRTTEAEPGAKMCKGILRAFPEFTDDVLTLWAEAANAASPEAVA